MFSSTELLKNGVDPEIVRWRAWRRSMHLTIPEAAAMAGVWPAWLQQVELGKGGHGGKGGRFGRPSVLSRLQALMARWEGHEPQPAQKALSL